MKKMISFVLCLMMLCSLLSVNVVIAEGTVDKSSLNTAIDNATTLIGNKTVGTAVGNVSQEAKSAFQAAIDEATTVKNNEKATQAEADEQVSKLASATTVFNDAVIKEGTVDKTELNTAIDNATALIGNKTVGSAVGNVSQEAKSAFQAAIDEATTVKNNEKATQAEADEQVSKLASATTVFNDAVIKEGTVDKTALNTAIDNATALIGNKTVGSAVGNVSQEAKSAFQVAIDEATTVKNNEKATQAEADEQVSKLASATTVFNNAVITDFNAYFDGGDGTENSPFLISNEKQLDIVRNKLMACYRLTNNIALTKDWVPIGDYNNHFIGKFDGNGYKITGVNIPAESTSWKNYGLFYTIGKGAEIKNLGVEINEKIEWPTYVGGLAGENYGKITNCFAVDSISADIWQDIPQPTFAAGLVGINYGTINNSYTTGSITVSANSIMDAGGLVGYNKGSITGSYSTSSVSSRNNAGGLVAANDGTITGSYATGSVNSAEEKAGGLVACNEGTGTIKSSYSTGSVSGEYAGGLVCWNESKSTITDSYAIGSVSGKSNAGGLIYRNEGTVSNSYYDIDTSGENDTGKGNGKSTFEMYLASTYTGWDFQNIWGISPSINNGYPYLVSNTQNPGESKGTLQINFPLEDNGNQYNKMMLTLSNISKNTKQTIFINNDPKYVFSGLDTGDTYKITITDDYENILDEIDNIILSKGIKNIEIAERAKSKTVNLTVEDNQGNIITNGITVRWYDANNKYILQGNKITEMPVDTTLFYEILLDGTLGSTYIIPDKQKYKVIDGDNNIEFKLSPISMMNLSGKAINKTDNNGLKDATVSISQLLNGKYPKNTIVTTDSNGSFSAKVLNDITNITVSKDNYVNQTIKNVQSNFKGNSYDIGEINLSPVSGAKITLNMTYTFSTLSGDIPIKDNAYYNCSNVKFTVFNQTQNKQISNFSVQYPYIMLLESANPGDVINIAATSIDGDFKEIQTSAKLDGNLSAAAQLDLVQNGYFKASYASSGNTDNVAIVYDSKGKYVKAYDFNNKTVKGDTLADGNYNVVFVGKSLFLNNIQNLSNLLDVGLVENKDYIKQEVQITSGVISQISNVAIPMLDESKLYYTDNKNTSFNINKSKAVAGSYFTLRSQYAFKDEYKSQINNIKVVYSFPNNCQLVPNSVLVGNSISSNYLYSNNTLTVPVSNTSDIVRFCVETATTGTYSINAFLQFDVNGNTIKQPMGAVSFEATGLIINVPEETAQKTVTISGITSPNSDITLYDNNIVVGQAKSLLNGSWSINYEIYKPCAYSYHYIYAEVHTQDGIKIISETKQLIYDMNYIQVSKVTMINIAHAANSMNLCEYDSTLDYLHPSAKVPVYWYWPNYPTFTFKIEFTNNSPDVVGNVFVICRSNSGETKLPATFDSNKNIWIATGNFNSNNIPTNVSVDYDNYVKPTVDLNNIIGDVNQQTYNFGKVDVSVNASSENEYSAALTLEDWNNTKASIDKKISVADSFNPDNTYTALKVSNGDKYYYKNSNKRVANDYTETTNLVMSAKLWNALIENLKPNDQEKYNDMKASKVEDDGNKYVEYTSTILIKDIYEPSKLLLSSSKATLTNGVSDDVRDSLKEYAENWLEEKVKDKVTQGNQNILESLRKQILSIPDDDICSSSKEMLLNRLNALEKRYSGLQGLESKLGNTSDISGEISGNVSTGISFFSKAIVAPAGQLGFMMEVSEIQQNLDSIKYTCPPDPSPSPAPDAGNVIPVLDPSGYVYEAVASNRVSGVTTTIYYKENLADTTATLWDATEYQQENPISSDANGAYAWDVPQGYWQVKYEKDGYKTAYSDWLPVPPPQVDVNAGITSFSQPNITRVTGYKGYIEIVFDKYMQTSTLITDNIKATSNGKNITGTIEIMNSEANPKNSAEKFATKVHFIPTSGEFASNDNVQLTVSNNVKSYANANMNVDYNAAVAIEVQPQTIVATDTVSVAYGGSSNIQVSVSPKEAAAGKKIKAISSSPSIATVSKEAILDDTGSATIPVTANMTGTAYISLILDGTDMQAQSMVNVAMPVGQVQKVSTPVSSVTAGSVSANTQIQLSTATLGAKIYYTTDGTCPCVSATRKLYTGAIVINSSTTIKAVAIKEGMNDSTVAKFIYEVDLPAPYIPSNPQPTSETRQIPVVVGNGNQQITAVQTTITRTTDSNGLKKDTVVFDENTAAATVKKALETKTRTVAIAVADIPGNNADKTEIQLPKASMTQLSANNMSLTLQTGKVSLEMPAEAVNESKGQDINVQVSEEKDISKIAENKGLILKLASGSQIIMTPLSIEANITGRVKITIPIDASKLPSSKEELDKFLSSLAVMVHHSDGQDVIDKGTLVYDVNGKVTGIAIWVDKFSNFTLISLPEGYFKGRTTVMEDKVSADKEWQIKFTKPADAATVTKDSVYVVDSKGNRVEVKVSYGLDNILKVTPVNPYTSGETYYLYISQKAKSKDRTSLVNELRYQFTIK